MFYPADKRVIKPIVTAFLESIGQEELISTYGLGSFEEDTAMQNHEAVETFYADYLDGRDSMVTVFEVFRYR